jgi:methionyl-tRNA formyltransferase
MGSPEFAVPTLKALVEAADFEVVRVVSQPDRPKGRGKKVEPTPVRSFALSRGLPTLEMWKGNYDEAVAHIVPDHPDFVVVAAFGVILRSDLLRLPRRACVNLHPSLLPRYRGVSPIQAAILARDAETGCTTMLIEEQVDAGDILLTRTVSIAEDDTAGSLEEKLATLGAPLIVATLRGLVAGTVTPVKQDSSLATYTKKIKKDDGRIDWTRSAEEISRRIRAMTPWPSAYTTFAKGRLIILRAAVEPAIDQTGIPGEIVSLEPLCVAAGDGLLSLEEVKVEGKKAMPARAFQAGYRLKPGDVLG